MRKWHISRVDLSMEGIIMEHLFRVDLTGIGDFQAVVTTAGDLGIWPRIVVVLEEDTLDKEEDQGRTAGNSSGCRHQLQGR